MPRVGFKPMIQMFEQAKTFRALDRAATVIGRVNFICTRKRTILTPYCHPNVPFITVMLQLYVTCG
jgi:hypothetical protein